jgi:adenylate cyclase class IV
MAVENEIRLRLGEGKLPAVKTALERLTDLGGYGLAATGMRDHEDTYFDVAGRLHQRNWSLRIRQHPLGIAITLKRPSPGASVTHVSRDELENPASGSFIEVVEQVSEILLGAGILEPSPASEGVVTTTLKDGVFAALRSLGLRDLFTVRSRRWTWDVSTPGGEVIAELALDDSHYITGAVPTGADAREARLEIELRCEDRLSELGQLAAFCRQTFAAEDAHDSKFEHGLTHYYATSLRDKLEAKVAFTEVADYDAVVKRIEEQEDFIPGHRFVRASTGRRITDVYFDTPRHDLFGAGCYLRLRHEDARLQLVFRRLTEQARRGLVLQHEVIVDETAADLARAWDSITQWLATVTRIPSAAAPTSLTSAPGLLSALGFESVLNVSILRSAWIVERVSNPERSDGRAITEHVAKLKHDHVTYSRPGDVTRLCREVEFEVTGVEDESAAPSRLQLPFYQTFLAQFVEACTHMSSDQRVEQRISAKYFRGMSVLGLARTMPAWLSDGRLALQTSLVRESPEEAPIPRTDLRPRLRLLSGIIALVAGWFALASGSDAGIGTGDSQTVWGSLVQLAGLASVAFALVALFRIPSRTLSTTYRLAAATVAAAVAVGISLPWFGRHATADVAGLLSIVLTWSSLIRDGLTFRPTANGQSEHSPE